ncbi:hypothetical protein E7W39_03760 [Cronobacter sakazakii]|nr:MULTISPECIES: hypothetical protein [Enterobacteriaceae]EGT4277856.1 hypothetical protein [Cronobacter sakazakii]EGT5666979.1 hypothetical protein [Cronobacter sakazakii]EGZ7002244.1 hypothetical protein [Cronobacter sakazakii]EGZ7011505.1 hypothetical protein [Cronobacter sakazakii]EGZ7015762.1 hypothetical protein [Cronobacter sakazakii]
MTTSYQHRLDTILERFSFNFAKGQINEVISLKSRSKEVFKQAVISAIPGNQKLLEKINMLGLLALQLDTRQVEVYFINDEATKQKLSSFLQGIKILSENVIHEAFPFPVEDASKLSQLTRGRLYPALSDKVEIAGLNYQRLVACAVVDKEIEEPVPPGHLSNEGRKLQRADTVYMMKRTVRTQLFHVIYWCPDTSKLILSVDKNTLSISASQDQLFVLRTFLMSNGIDCGEAINVFGAIEPLYNAVDGFITKLGHVTTNGNPVRIPLKSKEECLKKDHYHQAGENGGHVHAKFMVAKKWKFKVDGSDSTIDVEVGLMGQPKMLDTAQPLTDFSINDVKRLEDFSFSIDKVLSHIPNPKP